MTANRRIFLNIIATYGRSLYALVCGLFTARWVLQALGQVDFGLYGVVGGLTIFVAFLNTLLSSATSRFYAYAVGESKKHTSEGNQIKGIEGCRKWFSTSLILHLLVSVSLIAIGYPLGMYALEHWLTIPVDRLDACRWVFFFACISCFIGMTNVPFQAMYVAKQYIAELTVYSLATSTLNIVFVFFMVTHPDDWLTKYALWMCVISVVPQVIICLRAIVVFSECRFHFEYAFCWKRIARLASYAFWQAFGGLGFVLRGQGIQILINKYFGPGINASMSIANQVSGQTQTLATAMQGAFQPAIVTALGAGDVKVARNLAFRATKFALILTILFCLPLSIEINNVMTLWLDNPPPYSVGLCLCMIVFLIADKASIGQCLACNATGRIAAYQAVGGTFLILCLPVAWGMIAIGLSVYSIGFAIILTGVANTVSRVFFAKKLVGMAIKEWFLKIIIPVICVTSISCLPGLFIVKNFSSSFSRLALTIFSCEMFFIPLVWFFVLDCNERSYVTSKLRK